MVVVQPAALYHYGINGMKWGVRRFQNEDGSLTEAGKARYARQMSVLDSYKNKELKKLSKRSASEQKSLEKKLAKREAKTDKANAEMNMKKYAKAAKKEAAARGKLYASNAISNLEASKIQNLDYKGMRKEGAAAARAFINSVLITGVSTASAALIGSSYRVVSVPDLAEAKTQTRIGYKEINAIDKSAKKAAVLASGQRAGVKDGDFHTRIPEEYLKGYRYG